MVFGGGVLPIFAFRLIRDRSNIIGQYIPPPGLQQWTSIA